MKTVQVRISAEQDKQLREIADRVPGANVSGLAQRAIDLWLEIEGPVYMEAYKEVQSRRLAIVPRQAVSGRQ